MKPLMLGTGPNIMSGFIAQSWLEHRTSIARSRVQTFAVLTIRVIVQEVLLKALPQIQRRQWWQKLNLFISYESNFRRHFVSLSFARRPRKECVCDCACLSHERAQFMLKIANRPFAWWRHFTTMTRIVQVFSFLCKLGLLLFKPHCGYQI